MDNIHSQKKRFELAKDLSSFFQCPPFTQAHLMSSLLSEEEEEGMTLAEDLPTIADSTEEGRADEPESPLPVTLPTKQMLCDLRLLQALRRTTVLCGGPPALRVTTVSSRGWSPGWQETLFPGLKMIDLPVFFNAYRKQIGSPKCTLRQLVAASEDLCSRHRAIMEQEFEAQVQEYGTPASEDSDVGTDALLDDHAKVTTTMIMIV